jgi:type II secretory ATPase GspE/PulE/Tfp pilus assembly ATPase PilB-like protein
MANILPRIGAAADVAPQPLQPAWRRDGVVPAATAKAGEPAMTRANGERRTEPPCAKTLSDHGELAASEEEGKFLCLLDDGRLLIAEGQEMNPYVLSYRARLERMRKPYRTVSVALDMIARAYREHRADGIEPLEHTAMQTVAKELIAQACRERASDIHIRVHRHSTEILFRVHNELVRVREQTREHGERLLATLYAAMASVADNTYKPTERQDAAIGDRDKLPDQLFGVRIATAPTSVGSVMVLRLLYNDAGDDAELESLGFTAEHAATLEFLKEQPIGMNIISGPTGSGKSTTLQRVLASAIRDTGGSIHVITVEDPVEYPIAGAVQTPVVNAAGEEARSAMFAAAISNAMRLDPDTIMIGEVRDGASAQSALRAAMTGHQVWTTVHANNAISIVDRLIDLGLPLRMVTDESVITGLVSQRLVKLLCPHCKLRFAQVRDELDAALVARVNQIAGARLTDICVVGSGCAHCRQRGTIGRSVVAEVIRPDARFFAYLRDGDKAGALGYWLGQLGGETVTDHAIRKVLGGLVDPRMAERVVGHLTSRGEYDDYLREQAGGIRHAAA